MYLHSELYTEDLLRVAESVDARPFEDAHVLVTGSTGLIGSCLCHVLLSLGLGVHLTVAGRDKTRCISMLGPYGEGVPFVQFDACVYGKVPGTYDFIIHCASNAHPAAYISQPIQTMLANIEGTRTLLDNVSIRGGRLLYVSSSEVYGRRKSSDLYLEDDYCYVDLLDPRSCYPSSKRAAETLCAAYHAENGVDFVIVRPGHVYGPTMTLSDSRAHAQFARSAASSEPIVMRSTGTQLRSYVHAFDCATAMLAALTRGESGSAYNVSNPQSIVTVRQMAEAFAEAGNTCVEFENPDDAELGGYNRMECSALDSTALENLGWEGMFNMRDGAVETVNVLRERMTNS